MKGDLEGELAEEARLRLVKRGLTEMLDCPAGYLRVAQDSTVVSGCRGSVFLEFLAAGTTGGFEPVS